jgi:hypothetical protein
MRSLVARTALPVHITASAIVVYVKVAAAVRLMEHLVIQHLTAVVIKVVVKMESVHKVVN